MTRSFLHPFCHLVIRAVRVDSPPCDSNTETPDSKRLWTWSRYLLLAIKTATATDFPFRGAQRHAPFRRDPGRTHAAHRHLRAIQFHFERGRTNFNRVSGRCLFCRWRLSTIARSATVERHGQLSAAAPSEDGTHFVFGAKLGRDGLTAGLCFAAAMTTRSSKGECYTFSTIHGLTRLLSEYESG